MGDHDDAEQGAGDAGAGTDTEDLLAGLQAEEAAAQGDKPAPKAPPAKAKPAAEDADDAADEPEEEDDDEDGGDDEDELEDDDEDASSDPETDRRLDAVRRADERRRQAFDRERAAFDLERAEHAKSLARFESMKSRVRSNPTAVLRELGVTDDDLEHIAMHVAAHSKAPGVTPAHRAAAEQAARLREIEDRAKAAEEKAAAAEKAAQEREARAEADRVVDKFMRRVVRTVGDDAPLTKALVESKPVRARRELEVVAFELGQKHGSLPKPAKVIAVYERRLARRLEPFGVGKPAPATSTGAKPAPAKPAVVARNGKSKPAPAAAPARNGTPSRDDLLRELQEGAAEAE